MLTKVKIKNINSIVETEFSFKKCKYQYKNDMVYNNEIVSPIAFYGANGSGKSSFFNAISQLISMLTNEPSQMSGFIPHFTNSKEDNQFVLKTEGTSLIELCFELNNNSYVYYIESLVQNYIVSETLTKNNVEVFSRNKNEYHYKNKAYPVVAMMFPVLRTLDIEQNDEEIHLCYEYLSNICYIDASKKAFQLKIAKQKSYKDIIVEKSKEAREIFSNYKEFPKYDVQATTNEQGEKRYFAKISHNDGDLCLPWDLISSGMQNQSLLLSAVLSLPENGVLIVDELEDALHPLTIMDFIFAVQKRNIQLIFSSHNTFILQSLRPDQIYFAHWESGYSTYKRLSDFYPNIREVNNIEKMYLSNLFDEDIKK